MLPAVYRILSVKEWVSSITTTLHFSKPNTSHTNHDLTEGNIVSASMLHIGPIYDCYIITSSIIDMTGNGQSVQGCGEFI